MPLLRSRAHRRVLARRATGAVAATVVALPALGSLGCGGEDAAPDRHADAVARPRVERTIDQPTQRVAERALAGVDGSAVALDVRTGRVAVLARGGEGGDPTRELIPPGSTLKVLLAGLALEAHLITPDSRLEGDSPPVPGAANYRGARYGPITVDRALALSSNTAFAQVGLRLGAERIEAGLRRAGWGRPASIDLPLAQRAAGVVGVRPLVGPDGTYQDPDAHQRTTVLQLAQVAAAAGGDGAVRRATLHARAGQPARPVGRIWSAAVAGELRRGMRLAVTAGTAAGLRGTDVRMAAKTGRTRRADGRLQFTIIGLAPMPRPTVAVAVTAAADSERNVTVPIARRLLATLAR